MSNSAVFGAPMILTGSKPVSPFGAAAYTHAGEKAVVRPGRSLGETLRSLFTSLARNRRIRKTVVELSKLDDRTLRDIGLDRSMIISAAHEANARNRRFRR